MKIVVYKCYECGDEHSTDNVAPVCVQCFAKVKQSSSRLVNRLALLEAVAMATEQYLSSKVKDPIINYMVLSLRALNDFDKEGR